MSAAGWPAATASHYDPFAWWAETDGARPALIDAAVGTSYSYAAIHDDGNRCLAWLVEHGIRAGDRVAILAQNCYEFVPLFLGCIRLGAVFVPLNWRLSAVELSRVLVDASPSLLVCESQFVALAEAAGVAGIPLLDIESDVQQALATTAVIAASVGEIAPPSTDATAMVLYTSGSTGTPKGVMIPHRQLLWNAIETVAAWELTGNDVGAVATPLFHTSGWHVFATPLWSCGGAVVLMGRFDVDAYLDRLAEYRVTMMFVVPTQLTQLPQATTWGRPLPALRTFISGGAPCPSSTLRAVRAAGYRVRNAYGLTECGPNCFVFPDDAAQRKPHSVGWPFSNLAIRLCTEHETLVGSGEIGEVQLRGPQLFSGYYNAPEETAAAFTPDGWLRTGDLASIDDEGVYRIRGRRKEMFISGGENVFPGEVEAALLDCPGVLAAAVVGVPDAKWGEVGAALVVVQGDHQEPSHVLSELRSRLAGYKMPRHLHIADQLPLLGTGKIDRAAVFASLAMLSDVEPLAPDARVGED